MKQKNAISYFKTSKVQFHHDKNIEFIPSENQVLWIGKVKVHTSILNITSIKK